MANYVLPYTSSEVERALSAAQTAVQGLRYTNVGVDPSAFMADTTYANYPYRATITLSDVTTNHDPEVVFNPSDASSGKFSPISESFDGGVYVYAVSVPSAAMVIPKILCWEIPA